MAKSKSKSKKDPFDTPVVVLPPLPLGPTEKNARERVIGRFNQEPLEWKSVLSIGKDAPSVQRARVIGGWIYLAHFNKVDSSLCFIADPDGLIC